jgi:hypothetical protein
MVERKALSANGIVVLFLLVALSVGAVWFGVSAILDGTLGWILGVLVLVGTAISASGFTIIAPNYSKVVTFLGKYLGPGGRFPLDHPDHPAPPHLPAHPQLRQQHAQGERRQRKPG